MMTAKIPAWHRIASSIFAALAGIFIATPVGAQTAPADPMVRAGVHSSLNVPIYKSRIAELAEPARRVSIGNPDIADVLMFNPHELYILGKDLGTTNVLLWNQRGVLVSTISITVTHDISGLREKLTELFPQEDIKVSSAHRNIILSGQVSNAVIMDAAVSVARSYLEQAATAKDKIMFKEESSMSSNPDRQAGKVIICSPLPARSRSCSRSALPKCSATP